MKKLISALLAAAFLLTAAGCGSSGGSASSNTAEKTSITFANVGWDSIQLNNALAGLVAEEVFGYTWTEVTGTTPISHEALIRGDLDVHIEEWTNNISSYQMDLDAGKFVELGVNFDDNYQGFYIPRYVADAHPDLKTVKDLAKYPDLFPDPEDASKGIIYGGMVGWEITEIMRKKVEAYGLGEYYNYLESGSDAVLNTAMVSAWDKQEPIVAYYWEPTWLLGKYDFVLLEDEPYDDALYPDGLCACPAVRVTVAVSSDFAASNPEYCEFLAKFSMPSAYISEALAHKEEIGASDFGETAKWVLTQAHPELIDEWLTPEQAQVLRDAL